MKTIYQLAKAARRLPRITRKCMNALVHGRSPGTGPNGQPLPRKPLSEGAAAFERNRLAGCAQAAVMLQNEIAARRINSPAFRSALPLKKQRAILAAMESPQAEKLLAGQSLATA